MQFHRFAHQVHSQNGSSKWGNGSAQMQRCFAAFGLAGTSWYNQIMRGVATLLASRTSLGPSFAMLDLQQPHKLLRVSAFS